MKTLNVTDDMPLDTTIEQAWNMSVADRNLSEEMLEQTKLAFYDGVAFTLNYITSLTSNPTLTPQQGENHIVRLGNELTDFVNDYLRKYG